MKKLILILGLFFFTVLGHSQAGNSEQIAVQAKIKLFPNPATNVINVLGLENSDRAHILISDIYGNPVLQHQWKIKNNALSIPVAHLEKGVYLIIINSLEQKVRTKFYKQ
ncbi:T9SS type A sorting domain-containing protein [Ulvibacterium sp.]|uniref:T9SS type A sorting domain-containing protein n=1 Tax=Ulvibacterium sp. TaxID=2665914 RepID=UPI002618D828|nr:T9SS type A sorting domain-containing protein [Ulvibacterium sp.]